MLRMALTTAALPAARVGRHYPAWGQDLHPLERARPDTKKAGEKSPAGKT